MDAASHPLAWTLLALLALLAAVAAWTDMTQRRIPNWLCGLNLAAGLVYAGITYAGGSAWMGSGLGALHAVLALLVTMGLYAVGAIGAGDAKYYTSVAAWLPIGHGLWLLVSVALGGLALLAIFLILPGRHRAGPVRGGRSPFGKLPYGVAIGVGGLAAVATARLA